LQEKEQSFQSLRDLKKLFKPSRRVSWKTVTKRSRMSSTKSKSKRRISKPNSTSTPNLPKSIMRSLMDSTNKV
jgi:hypothetical protein